MTDKPHKRMGPAPIEGETLSCTRMIRFGPTMTKRIEKRAGPKGFAAWVRDACRRLLGGEPDSCADEGDEGGRQDPAGPSAV